MKHTALNNSSDNFEYGFEKESEFNYSRYLTFLLSKQLLGVNLFFVKEIIEHNEITAIPKLPEFIRGAINLRGKVIPVVDLSLRLGYLKTEISKRTCIIVIELNVNQENMNVGILVDSVHQVTNILNTDLENAPTFGGNIDVEYIEAMAKMQEKFVVILNIDRLLSMDDIRRLQDVTDTLEQGENN